MVLDVEMRLGAAMCAVPQSSTSRSSTAAIMLCICDVLYLSGIFASHEYNLSFSLVDNRETLAHNWFVQWDQQTVACDTVGHCNTASGDGKRSLQGSV